MDILFPIILLNNVDLPTFGLSTIAITSLLIEYSSYEFPGHKFFQIFNTFTYSHILYGHVKFIGNGDGNSPFSRSVKFRQYDAGEVTNFSEFFDLGNGILPMWRIRVTFAH